MKIKFKDIALILTAIIATVLYPILFLYFNNVGELSFSNVFAPIIFSLLGAVLVFSLDLLLTKSTWFACIDTVILILLFFNYAIIEQAVQFAFPSLRYWHIVPILIFVFLHIFYLYRRLSQEIAQSVCGVIALVFCALILVNAIMAVPVILEKVQSNNGLSSIQQGEISNAINNEGANQYPNIYYILMDEYSSVNFMKQYYKYDNKPFVNELEKKGFTVSLDSFNDSCYTGTVMANIHQLDYIANDEMPEDKKYTIREQSKIYSMLSNAGYFTRSIAPSGHPIPADEVIVNAMSYTDIEFVRYLWGPTAAYPFTIDTAYNGGDVQVNALYAVPAISGNKPVFTNAHILLPHEPFYFAADGAKVPPSNSKNYDDKDFYLGQYIYTTKLVTKVIDEILSKDPNCIIVLQSDHSSRFQYWLDKGELLKKYNVRYEDMKACFNAVYYQGEPIHEIEGQSGMNTWRIVLQKLLGIDLPLKEIPYD